MPTSSKGRIRKCILNRRKLKRAEVLKILAAAMENANPSTSTGDKAVEPDDFYSTGRVGRRNAMPDILGSHCTTTTSDLPDKLKALTTDDKKPDSNNGIDNNKASTSQATPSTSTSTS